MIHNFSRTFFLYLLIFTGATHAFALPDTTGRQKDIDHIRYKCRQLLLSDTPYATERSYMFTDDIKYDTDAVGYFQRLAIDGSWPDIDYKSPMRSSWKPSWHLYRTMLICRAYFKTKDPRYLEAVHRALYFWLTHDFQCSNWWQNQINVPFAYSSLMLMLDNLATRNELNYLDAKLAKRMLLTKATGQNLIWQYDNQARLALVHHDSRRMGALMKAMQQAVQVSTNEGIQPDYSFQQHGVMLQFGNYGIHFLNSLIFWMNVTAGSPYSFSKDRQQILYKYAIDGLKWTIYKGGMDITSIGRQIRKDYTTKRGTNLFDDFRLLKETDPDKNNCRYQLDGFQSSSNPKCALKGNKGFWRSAYMIQRSVNYMMSVKTSGNAVKKVESINGENLKGSFLNDGVTLIQHSGLEYRNIEALWNWDMLPGTTCDTTVDPASKKIFESSNASNYVGQVSNGNEGISAMYYNRLGVSAYKSYFFVDGMMVALGSNIRSENAVHVVTTINQRFCHEQNNLVTGKTPEGLQWIWQDSITYLSLLKQQRIKTQFKHQTSNWNAIDQASDDKTISGNLLTLYLAQENCDQYAYLIKPTENLKEIKNIVNLPVTLISNTESIQSIKTKNNYLIVFYRPGNMIDTGKVTITADQPCMMMCEKKDAHWHVWIADPTGKVDVVKISINKSAGISVKFPTGAFAGSSEEIVL